MRSFNDLIERFADDRDRVVRSWVQKAVRGLAECMAELKQLREARSVYRNFISRADPEDPDLPGVYLRAAELGRRLGLERNDPVAFDEAIEDLHTLLERFGGAGGHGSAHSPGGHDNPPPEVAQARLMIGGLLFDARRWQEAETHLLRYQQTAGGRSVDQVDAWLAECALQLKRPDDALPRFERLHAAWLDGKGDGLTPAKVYVDAAYRTGLCHLHATKPRYIEALFAFQRAAKDFPSAALEPEVLVAMAACYAQIEQEANAVETLLGMLKADTGPDGRGGRLALDSVVGDLMGRLAEHPGPVRARAYFYIAQATFRRAERERADRTTIAAQAIGYYDRVLGENPPPELKAAAQLGLARAAFLAGNDERGLAILRGLRSDAQTLPRDREFANRLLGDWYRAQGKNREAVRAFRGETEGL
jgi:tetratricopeptide (TPR) repeat protein